MAPNKPLFLLLFLLFFHFSFSRDCDYDSIPENLNVPGYLSYDGEFHSHSEFFVNFSAPIPKIRFTLEQTSIVRMYIAPHEVELDLALYSGVQLVRSSHDEIETMVEGTLEGGKGIESYFQLTHHASAEQIEDCPTLIMELAIIPIAVQESRVNAMKSCSGSESFPTSVEVFAGLSQGLPVSFNSDLQGYSFDALSTDDRISPRVIEKLPFTIPVGTGRQNVWTFNAKLRADFIVGGSLGMTVTDADVEVLTRECMESGECEPATALLMNSKSIR